MMDGNLTHVEVLRLPKVGPSNVGTDSTQSFSG